MYLTLKKYLKNIRYIPLVGDRVGYIGWLQHGNLGDEAMYQAARTLFNGNLLLPYKHHARMQDLENVFNKRIFKFVMLGGGTLINTRGFGERLRQAQDLNYPTVVFGSGVRNPEFWDRIPDELNRMSEWMHLLERCQAVGVRGPITRSILEDYGFHKADKATDRKNG